jgi:hypothetical protein
VKSRRSVKNEKTLGRGVTCGIVGQRKSRTKKVEWVIEPLDVLAEKGYELWLG